MSLYICDVGKTDIAGAPGRIKLLPLGRVSSRAGDFTVDAESYALMLKHFKQRGIDVVIDYEHQTLKDVQAPAGGWIKELFLEDDAITAAVEWTQQAREYLQNKEYRYLSPVINVRKSDKKAVALHSAALTNTPAINGMFPVVNSYKGEDINMEFLKQLAVLLGLPEDAAEEQILGALKKLVEKPETDGSADKVVANKVICELLGLNAGAATEDVAAKIIALKNEKPAGYVSESDFLALKNKMDRRDADEAVTLALKSGKLAPAQKDWATQYALNDPEGFKTFVLKAPQVVPMGELTGSPAVKSGAVDEATLAVCKQLGVSAEDVKKYSGKDVE